MSPASITATAPRKRVSRLGLAMLPRAVHHREAALTTEYNSRSVVGSLVKEFHRKAPLGSRESPRRLSNGMSFREFEISAG